MLTRNLFLIFVLLSLPLSANDDDPAISLLRSAGWEVEAESEGSTIELPKSFGGIPYLHYHKASAKAGLDLEKGKGQRVKMRRFLLTQRSERTQSKLFAHIALLQGTVIGAWLSTDAPVAPGIWSVKDREFVKGL